MMMPTVLMSLVLVLSASAHADDSIFSAPAAQPAAMLSVDGLSEAAEPGVTTTQVFVDPSVAKKLAQQPGASVKTVSEEEAIAAAGARGVTIRPWGHPWVIVRAGIGLPGNIQLDIEVYVHKNWAVEVGAGTGLLGGWYTGAVRWHPDATTWNWFKINHETGAVESANTLQLTWGAELGFTPENVGWGNRTAGIYITPQIEAAYIHRFAEHFGWTIGARVGIGPAFELVHNWQPTPNDVPPGGPAPTPTPGNNPPPTGASGGQDHISTDMALSLLIYTGFTF